MKLLIFMIALMLSVVMTSAQTTILPGNSYSAFNGETGDTLNYSTDSTSFEMVKTFYLGQLDPGYTAFIEFDLDTVTRAGLGTDSVTVIRAGSTNGLKYYNIDTAYYYVTVDTTLTWDNLGNSTGYPWRYQKFTFESDSLSTQTQIQIPTTGRPIRFTIVQ